MQQGTTGQNIGRLAALAGGLPVTVAGMTIDRQCSSGLMAIATAAKQITEDNMSTIVAGGLESISLVQNKHKNSYRAVSKAVLANSPNMYLQMIETAEIVADRYNISRQAQDEYSFQSQQRTAAAQEAGAVTINYGVFANALVSFIIIAFAVFMVVRGFNKLKKEEEAAPKAPPAPSAEEGLLTEIRDLLKAQA